MFTAGFGRGWVEKAGSGPQKLATRVVGVQANSKNYLILLCFAKSTVFCFKTRIASQKLVPRSAYTQP
jgi:hypothetical protein